MVNDNSLDGLKKIADEIGRSCNLGSLSMTLRSPVTPVPTDDEVLAKAQELVKKNGGTLFSLSKLHNVPERKHRVAEFGFVNSVAYAPSYYGIYIADTRDILGLKYEGIMGNHEKKMEESSYIYHLRIVEIGTAAYESTIGLGGIFDHVNSPQLSVSNAGEFSVFRDVINGQISKEVADYYRRVTIRAMGHDNMRVMTDTRKIPNDLKMGATFYAYRCVLEPLLRCMHILDSGTFEADIAKIDDKCALLESHQLLQIELGKYGEDSLSSEEKAAFDDVIDYLISKTNILYRESKLRDKPSAEDIAKLQNLIIEMRLKRLV